MHEPPNQGGTRNRSRPYHTPAEIGQRIPPAGSGKGCAHWNAISNISVDPEITDFPERSARPHPLAAFVQSCNDLLAGPDGYLSPENSLLALELGWYSRGNRRCCGHRDPRVGTELLASPTWGVVRYAKSDAAAVDCDFRYHGQAALRSDVVCDMPPITPHGIPRPGDRTRCLHGDQPARSKPADSMPSGQHTNRLQSSTPIIG